MKIIETNINGALIIEPQIFKDKRGFFLESYNRERYYRYGINNNFIQDNISASIKGVLRGLHFQKPPYGQSKLVQVIEGQVLDVAVDIRKSSSSFGEWTSVLLSGENKKQFYLPKGLAHGFVVLSDSAVFSYKCDELYHPEAECSLKHDDSDLNIDWQIPEYERILSQKDKNAELTLKIIKESDTIYA